MITYTSFDEMLNEFQSKNSDLASFIKSKHLPKIDLSYLAEYNWQSDARVKWEPQAWWANIERGIHIPAAEFFNAWIPGWKSKKGPFLIVTMSSYTLDKIFVVPPDELLGFHDRYADYSTDHDKFLQGCGDYVAYDLSDSQVYLLQHEGYTANFNIALK